MKRFVDWVLAQPYRLVVLAILFAPLMQIVTAALIVLNTLHRGAAAGALAAAAGAGALALLAVATGGAGLEVAVLGTLVMAAGAAIGAILIWGRMLALGFQGLVLGSLLLAAAITVLGPEPQVLIRPVVDQAAAWLGEDAPQLQAMRDLAPALVGFMLAAAFAQLVGAMLLGYWWFGLARADVQFGVEFRALALGRVVGITAIIVVMAGLLSDALWVRNLAPIALFAFLYQGAAVMHAWAHAKRWHPAWLWLVYVALITPWTWLAILGLSAVGLIDNIFALRSRLRMA